MASKRKNPDAEYEVGYQRPPRLGQFQPGESGNPRGRPKKIMTIVEALRREADRTVQVQIGGELRKMTKLEVLVRKTFQSAIDGNMAAARILVPLLIAEPDAILEADADLPLDEQALEQLVARLVRHSKNSKKEGN